MTRGFLGLGSNLGDKRAHLAAALATLGHEPGVEIRGVAGFYRTVPMGGPADQDWYLNTVVEIGTELQPRVLLERCQAIERSMGRMRIERWGPRTIDLDILWLEGVVENTPHLMLPHPGAHSRSFVLMPWRELAPHFMLRGHSLDYWLKQADPLGIVVVP